MIIEAVSCPICREPFTPQKNAHGWSKTCGAKLCKAGWQSIIRRGQPVTAACQARMRNAKARRVARLREQFGELSDREHAILRIGLRVGYQQAVNREKRA